MYAACDGERVVSGGGFYLDGATAWLGRGSIIESRRQRGGHIATETGEPIADEPNPSLATVQPSGFECVASRLNYAGSQPDRSA